MGAGVRRKTMKKRNVYDEINAGFNHLENARLGKTTLYSVQVEIEAAVTIYAKEVKVTLEQGNAKPNAQVASSMHLEQCKRNSTIQ